MAWSKLSQFQIFWKRKKMLKGRLSWLIWKVYSWLSFSPSFHSLLSVSVFRFHRSWVLWHCTGVSSRFWITAMPTCRCISMWVWSPRLSHWEVRGQLGATRGQWLPSPLSLCCLAPRPTPSISELVALRLQTPVCLLHTISGPLRQNTRLCGRNWDWSRSKGDN